MPRICGFYRPRNGKPSDGSTLRRMAAAMGIAPDALRVFSDPGQGLFIGEELGEGSVQATRINLTQTTEDHLRPPPLSSSVEWDRRTETLILASDMFGREPVYYFVDPLSGGLYFASELKALLVCEALPRRIDREALSLLFVMGYIPPPRSILSGVSRLLPFETLSFDASGGLTRERIYRNELQGTSEEGVDYWGPRLRSEIIGALETCLVDVSETAVFSSGGVDSLALLSGISQLGSKRPTALTIAYDTAAGAGELEAGAAAAHAAGLAHEALLVNPEDLKPESASQIFRRFDEPCMVFNRGPTQFFLTAAAQRLGLKVAVSGAMGENVVGDMAWLAKVKDMPDATQGLSDEEFFATMLARRRQLFAEDDAQVLSRVDTPVAQLLLQLTQDFTQGVQTRSRYENYMAMSVFLASTGELTACGRVISRLNGIEERLPFADRRLFEFMQSVPPRLKGSETLIKQRDLLRAAFANDEPMASRPPVSGALPGFPWQASPWLASLVLKQAKRIANDDHLLAPALARKVLEKYQRRRGRRDAKLVWMLFALQTWFDLNIAEDDPFRQAA